jgi:Radical SAM superfamily.
MKRFKKIYVEITNICNLSCSFCSKSNKVNEEMELSRFENIIKKIKPYTDYIYLHVKGEPLLHSKLDNILSICDLENIKVNITTNGTLLKDSFKILSDHNSVRQLNLSLHSENFMIDYFDNIFETCKKLSDKIYISYRLWTLNNNILDKKSTDIVDKIIDSYSLSTDIVDKLIKDKQIKIDFNTYVNKDNLFEWPSIDIVDESDGYCHGLIDHVAILVDGTVVPCCLDGEGVIKLGNIFEEEFDAIINGDKASKIITSFKNNKCYDLLCKKCSFKNRFK